MPPAGSCSNAPIPSAMAPRTSFRWMERASSRSCPDRAHLSRYHGVFACNGLLRQAAPATRAVTPGHRGPQAISGRSARIVSTTPTYVVHSVPCQPSASPRTAATRARSAPSSQQPAQATKLRVKSPTPAQRPHQGALASSASSGGVELAWRSAVERSRRYAHRPCLRQWSGAR